MVKSFNYRLSLVIGNGITNIALFVCERTLTAYLKSTYCFELNYFMGKAKTSMGIYQAQRKDARKLIVVGVR